jgi:anaerobic magnesium-protoporphyrin IX monomethyl ester cyclase
LVQVKPWGISSDREIVVQGRRSPEFYENADKLLRSEVKLARLSHNSESEQVERELQQQVTALRESLYAKSCQVSQ